MKPASTFLLGTAVGAAVGILAFLVSPRGNPSAPSSVASGSTSAPPAVPVSVAADNTRLSSSTSANPGNEDDDLEQALRELREGGFAVVPQEFAVFCSPLFETNRGGEMIFGSHLSELLQLDERELASLGAAIDRLSEQLDAEASRRLAITDASEFALTARVPAFPEIRETFIANARTEIVRALDADSGALFSHLRLNDALAFQPIGSVTSTLHIRRPVDDESYHVTLTVGDNHTVFMRLAGDELTRRYPQLSGHLPATEMPRSP
jgi:hypothetical protein